MEYPINVALVGIGEHGHLAFNDQPADFDITDPYIIVESGKQYRRQSQKDGLY